MEGLSARGIVCTECGRKSSHGYLLFLGLARVKTFFRELYKYPLSPPLLLLPSYFKTLISKTSGALFDEIRDSPETPHSFGALLSH